MPDNLSSIQFLGALRRFKCFLGPRTLSDGERKMVNKFQTEKKRKKKEINKGLEKKKVWTNGDF